MATPTSERMLPEVNITAARNLSPLFDEAVRREHPIRIVRGRRDRGVLLSEDLLRRVLRQYQFHVDVIPEPEGGFTLWVNELNLGEHGPTLLDSRRALLDGVRSYVRHYLDNRDFFRHLPDRAQQEPYIYRLALVLDDVELIDVLFGAEDATGTGEHASVTAR